MAAGMFAVPAPASAAQASTKLVWDNHRLYDPVVPLLRGHGVVTFDFLGWEQSSKPSHYSYTFATRNRI
jgi:hypothetical protein